MPPTYDKDLALGRAMRRRWLPPELPAPFPNPREHSINTNFLIGPTSDWDAGATDNTIGWYEPQNYIYPSRPYGHDVMDSSLTPYRPQDGVGGWENCSIGTGTISSVYRADSDPAIDGYVFKLESGATAGGIAGLRRTMPTVPTARFSQMLMVGIVNGYAWTTAVPTDPSDAAYVILTNNEGASLVTRYYYHHGEILCGDLNDPVDTSVKWRLFAGHVDNFIWECWPEAKKVSSGVYDVTVRAGTTIVGSWQGALPFNYNGLGNNKQQFHQASATRNYCQFLVRTFNIGSTQNAASGAIVSKGNLRPESLSSAQMTIHLGETSGDLKLGTGGSRLNEDLELWVSATDGAYWTKVQAEVIAQVGKDVIDPTKNAYLIGGTADFSHTGNNMRWQVKFKNEYFGTLQAVQMLAFSS